MELFQTTAKYSIYNLLASQYIRYDCTVMFMNHTYIIYVFSPHEVSAIVSGETRMFII